MMHHPWQMNQRMNWFGVSLGVPPLFGRRWRHEQLLRTVAPQLRFWVLAWVRALVPGPEVVRMVFPGQPRLQ